MSTILFLYKKHVKATISWYLDLFNYLIIRLFSVFNVITHKIIACYVPGAFGGRGNETRSGCLRSAGAVNVSQSQSPGCRGEG